MELDAKILIEIFKNNFDYPIVQTPLGTAVKMDWYNAFLYANVTGAGYMDNYIMPFTPKGLLKIFYNAFDYNFVTGLFENTSFKYTPRTLREVKPFLFENDKYLLFVEFNKEVELQEKLREYMEILSSKKIDSKDFIIQRIEKSKTGNGMESFMEYLACEYFKNINYIVENQIPLAHTVGSPDFGGYQIANIISFLKNKGLISNGFHIIELAMIFLKANRNDIKSNIDILDQAIVGEAKTSVTKMTMQLQKYLDAGLFRYGVELHPSKEEPGKKEFALLTIDNNYKIVFKPQEEKETYNNIYYSKEDYYYWLEIYMKFYLLANLSNDQLAIVYKEKMREPISNTEKLVKFVQKIELEEIWEEIWR